MFHHDPMHSDDFLDDLYREARDRWRALGGDPTALEMAAERAEVDLPAHSVASADLADSSLA
jgi:hypothetical protein